MAEIRLIDGNELRGIESLLNTDIIQSRKEASWLMSQVLHDIDATPTIDPETLSIVRELREKLERVTAERDALAANSRPAVHGAWKTKKIMIRTPAAKNYVCSVCGEDGFNTNFCPNCGARMVGGDYK